MPVLNYQSSFLRYASKGRRFQMVSLTEPVRVRFAPSPTGSLHVGGARTALFNWLLARKTKGTFIIRVEDTDEARSTKESEDSILNDLRWLQLNWDEGPDNGGPYGPYRQSERKEIYKQVAEQLIAEGKAYRCFCSEEELEKKRIEAEAKGEDPKYDGTWRDADPKKVEEMLASGAPYTVRFKVPKGKVVSINDVVRGTVTWDADASLGDFIIMRSSGMPVYNFCVSVDDAKMKVTHVIRAEEHLTNTLRQMLLLEAMNYKPPTYAHCSLILGSDRSKLSKRHGATSVKQFSEQGFIPAAMINYLANLGWSDGTNKEIFSPQELVQAFDVNRIVKSAAVFDLNKLTWINSQHCRSLPLDQIQPIVLKMMQKGEQPILDPNHYSNPTAEKPGHFNEFLNIATKIAQRDMDLTTDTNRLLGNCLQYHPEQSLHLDPHINEVLNDDLVKIVNQLIQDFEQTLIPKGDESNFNDLWKAYVKTLGGKLGLKGKNLFHPLRFALTGRMSGPDIGDQLKLVALSQGIIHSSYPLTPLAHRINYLKQFNLENSKKIAAEAAALLAAAATNEVAVSATA